LPLELVDPADYDAIAAGHRLRITAVTEGLTTGALVVHDEAIGRRIETRCQLTARERDILLAGGRLAHTRGLGSAA
jgi:aconitate hydratase